jgi:DNA-binding CsgD family transcriptional regulator
MNQGDVNSAHALSTGFTTSRTSGYLSCTQSLAFQGRTSAEGNPMELSHIVGHGLDDLPAAIAIADLASPGASAGLLMRVLDEIDHGMVLVDAGGAMRYANQLGHHELLGDGPLVLARGRVLGRQASDQSVLHVALFDAQRGRRTLFSVGHNGRSVSIAAVPMPSDEHTGDTLVLLVFGKRPAAETLTVDFFARSHDLTNAETQVLKRICSGMKPKEIAIENCVAISTVRSHICNIRVKTQTASIRELVNRVAVLPPITPAVKTAARPVVH